MADLQVSRMDLMGDLIVALFMVAVTGHMPEEFAPTQASDESPLQPYLFRHGAPYSNVPSVIALRRGMTYTLAIRFLQRDIAMGSGSFYEQARAEMGRTRPPATPPFTKEERDSLLRKYRDPHGWIAEAIAKKHGIATHFVLDVIKGRFDYPEVARFVRRAMTGGQA